MTIQILGAGLGRTGTFSLKIALEELGFGPCHHMSEVGENAEHVALWNKVEERGDVDWSKLYKGYNSAVDWPTVSFLPQLLLEYPQAKVVLTLRDPEEWYESARDTIFKLSVLGELASHIEEKQRADLSSRLILEKFFSNRFDEKDFCVETYIQHTQKVRDMVEPGSLLEYYVTDGWKPLCDFLEVPVPETSFPNTNSRKSFISRQVLGK